MSVNVGTAIGYLELDTSKFKSGFDAAKKQLQGFTNSTSTVSEKFNSLGNGLKTVGSNLSKYVTVPLAGIGVGASKAAIDFESAFAGVKKTVDATDTQLAKLEEGIRDLAKEMPTAATEIAGVAEAAGQLGIKVPNIMDFTKTMVMLGDSTNMSAEEAATSLARLANITGMPQTQFDKLGSTIVALGNNLATTESEITAMGLRLAGAGAQVGMSEAQIMSFAGALSSVGIQAEAGGSAFSKVMVNMQLATETGGKKLEQFAKVAGMSSSEFSKAFKEDATGAIISFIKGLGNAESQGKSAIGILDDMGIKEVVLRDTLLRAAGASDVFTDALEIGTNAWDKNNALTNEASQRYETTASKLLILKNKFIDVGITIGDALLPHIQNLVDGLGKMADWFSNLSPGMQSTIISIAGIAAAIGPALMIIGQMSIGIGALITSFNNAKLVMTVIGGIIKNNLLGNLISFNMFISTTIMPILTSIGVFITGTIIPILTTTAFTIGTVTVPIWAVIAGIAALIAIGVLLYNNWDEIKAKCSEVWSSISEFLTTTWESLKENVSNVWDSITSFISKAWESIKSTTNNIWESIKGNLKTVWDAIKSVIEPPVKFIKDLIKITWDFISSTTSTIWNSIMGILKSVWDLIAAVVKLGIAVVQLAVTVAWNTIKSVTTTIWDGIKSTISTIWNFISSLASTIWNNVKNVIITVWDAIKPYVETSVNFIKNIINTVFNSIKSFVSTVWNSIKSTISTVWDAIKTKVSTVVNAIKTVITTVFTAIKSVITTIVNGWLNIITTVWNNIKTVVSNGANLVKSTIQKVFNTLETILTAPFKGAEKVISGILGGITSAINKVTSAVNSVKNSSKSVQSKMISSDEADFIEEEYPYSLARNIENFKRLVYSDKEAKTSIVGSIKGITSSTKGIKGNNSDRGYSNKNVTINNTYNSPKPASIYELKKQDEITMRRLAMQL